MNRRIVNPACYTESVSDALRAQHDLSPEVRDWLDRVIVPALVEQFLREKIKQ